MIAVIAKFSKTCDEKAAFRRQSRCSPGQFSTNGQDKVEKDAVSELGEMVAARLYNLTSTVPDCRMT